MVDENNVRLYCALLIAGNERRFVEQYIAKTDNAHMFRVYVLDPRNSTLVREDAVFTPKSNIIYDLTLKNIRILAHNYDILREFSVNEPSAPEIAAYFVDELPQRAQLPDVIYGLFKLKRCDLLDSLRARFRYEFNAFLLQFLVETNDIDGLEYLRTRDIPQISEPPHSRCLASSRIIRTRLSEETVKWIGTHARNLHLNIYVTRRLHQLFARYGIQHEVEFANLTPHLWDQLNAPYNGIHKFRTKTFGIMKKINYPINVRFEFEQSHRYVQYALITRAKIHEYYSLGDLHDVIHELLSYDEYYDKSAQYEAAYTLYKYIRRGNGASS